MIIRPALVHEANRIAEIHEQTACVAYAHIFPDQPFPREQTIRRWQNFPGQIVVSEEGDVLIGFVAFDETELHALYVLPGYQGRGIGSRLLAAADDASCLWVLQENHSARRFYEAHGWVAEGRVQSAFGAVEMLYCRIQTKRITEEPQERNNNQVGLLMALLRDSSQDVYGAHVPGRGEFAPRRQAVAELVKLGSLAVEPLCHALQDENGYTRRFAAEALRRIGDPRAALPLVIALQTSEVYVQRYVADALAVVGDERAVEPLYQALQNPDLAREALLALQAIVERTAATLPTAALRLVASLPDNGHYIEEVPDTDGGYLSWERVERWLDYRAVKALVQRELARRGLAVEEE